MSRIVKLILKILSGNSDSNISFSELCNLLDYFGFSVRIKGDHYIYFKDGIDEIINLQPLGNKAKTYQVKQIRNIILKYKLLRDNYE
ncbi:type II toxin-antitoxin system HicA family toxin [Bacteroidetes/Chlorobi group bacterium ChocPot_Mid]|jgi:hypothetical protein|nr:MAG: type II toxin-antitoxin system HicA family toxin [Bacteroidetes/Chlorobi group bacterium ChocPot_Mid]